MNIAAQNAWNKISLLVMLHYAHQSKGAIVDNLRIQKTAFLTELRGREKHLKSAYYEFFRCKLGPFSKGLANDVTSLEAQGFIDSESRELTERGKYLCRYVQPEIEKSSSAQEAIAIAKAIGKDLRPLGSPQIVNKVYALRVPVDGMGSKVIRIKDIPLHTDILIPKRDITSRNVEAFSDNMVEEIEAELSFSPLALDPTSKAFQISVENSLRRALLN
jgi:uncharacterized protein YwgA